MDRNPPGFSDHGTLQERILEWVAVPFPGDLPDPGIEPESPVAPALQADSLLLSHWRSPKLLLGSIKKTGLEKAMAPHSSTLAWKIPWTEEPGRLQSMGSLGVRHD